MGLVLRNTEFCTCVRLVYSRIYSPWQWAGVEVPKAQVVAGGDGMEKQQIHQVFISVSSFLRGHSAGIRNRAGVCPQLCRHPTRGRTLWRLVRMVEGINTAGKCPPKLFWPLLFASAAKSAVPRTWDGCFWEGGNSCRCWVWGGTGSWYPAPIFSFASLE